VRAALLALLILAMAPAAWAGESSHGCSYTSEAAAADGTASGGGASKRTITANEVWCYRFIAGDGTHNTATIQITAASAVIYFDPDLYQTVTTTARVIPHYCPHGAPTDTSNPLRSCPSIGGANGNTSLDGTAGPDTTQNQAIRVGPGTYLFEISAACEAGDTCQIAVKGEGEGAY
jgi:hypothetical protein